jgi:hypothetical protein
LETKNNRQNDSPPARSSAAKTQIHFKIGKDRGSALGGQAALPGPIGVGVVARLATKKQLQKISAWPMFKLGRMEQ